MKSYVMSFGQHGIRMTNIKKTPHYCMSDVCKACGVDYKSVVRKAQGKQFRIIDNVTGDGQQYESMIPYATAKHIVNYSKLSTGTKDELIDAMRNWSREIEPDKGPPKNERVVYNELDAVKELLDAARKENTSLRAKLATAEAQKGGQGLSDKVHELEKRLVDAGETQSSLEHMLEKSREEANEAYIIAFGLATAVTGAVAIPIINAVEAANAALEEVITYEESRLQAAKFLKEMRDIGVLYGKEDPEDIMSFNTPTDKGLADFIVLGNEEANVDEATGTITLTRQIALTPFGFLKYFDQLI